MKLHVNSIALCACLLFALQGAASEEPTEKEASMPKVLFLTHSAGFAHEVVQRPQPDTLSFAERNLVEAAEGRLEVLPTQDCARITAEGLKEVDAVVFYTSGELPIAVADREALLEWVRAGGAFVGVHSATDTFLEYAPYQELIGGVFDGHPWHEKVGVLKLGGDHPAVAMFEDGTRLVDEIYQHKQYRRHPVRPLLGLDVETVDASLGKREAGDYDLAWCREWGEGRVFHTALGHRHDLWRNELFREHLVAGIEWALSREDWLPPAPEGAVVLVSGEDLSAWQHRDGKPASWKADGLAIEVTGGGDLVTLEEYGDCVLHLEFQIPTSTDALKGQARGNSGVYLQGRYEVQVLGSHGEPDGLDSCGAIYGIQAVARPATRPAGAWQSYDIHFRAPRFDEAGEKLESARMSVWQNGLPIHRDVEVPRPTTAALPGPEAPRGPLLLQDHGNPVRYRNVWLLPVEVR